MAFVVSTPLSAGKAAHLLWKCAVFFAELSDNIPPFFTWSEEEKNVDQRGPGPATRPRSDQRTETRGSKRHRDSKQREQGGRDEDEGSDEEEGGREGGEMMERWSRQRSLFSL